MIKTWRQRCEEHPDHDGIVSDGMIQARMQEEIDELRAAIEQAQEPVAWMTFDSAGEEDDIWYDNPDGKLLEGWTYKPLYTAPPRQWQGLTDEDREEILRWVEWKEVGSQPVAPQKLIAYVERKLREKNT